LPKAAIFDLDGTLLDSVDLHALAWQEAMLKFGHDVGFEQMRGQIGKGGDKLIPVFLSADEQLDHGKELEEWRSNRFKTEYLPLVRPFSRSRTCCDVFAPLDFRSRLLPRPRRMKSTSISTSQASPTWWT